MSNGIDLAREIRRALCFSTLFLLPLFALGCSGSAPREEPQAAREIAVGAAANLTDAFEEIGKRFGEKTGIKVVFSFGGTADLARQIENGAPFDLFASADVASVDRLVERGLIVPETRGLFARGRLVLWMPKESRAAINKVEDLERAEISLIAVAKPEIAPYGRAAVEALERMNLWPRVKERLVYATNVAQAKQFAASGNADAAFIPLSLVKPGEGRYIEIESKLHAPLDHEMGVIEASGRKDAARRFEEFVLGDEGQAVMERFGYRRPVANE